METSELAVGTLKVSASGAVLYFGHTLEQWMQLTAICMAVVNIVVTLPAAYRVAKVVAEWVRNGRK
jgi:hypothetical protein